MRAVVSKPALLTFLLLGFFSSIATALEQTYQLYSKNGDYYLKADPTWIPISGEIFIILPLYAEGEILKLTLVSGSWQAQNITLNQFNTTNPTSVSDGHLEYDDFNADGLLDISVMLGASAGNQVVRLLSGNSSSTTFVTNQRRVVFIHTDLLGSPAAESDENGAVK